MSKKHSEELISYIHAILSRFGRDASMTAADFLARADELDTVFDLARVLSSKHGDSVGNFTIGYFGGGPDIPDVSERKVS